MINVIDKDTHFELIRNTDNSLSYNRCFFFFLGFHQIAAKFISKFKKILDDSNITNTKICIIKMKEYHPDESVSFFLSKEQLEKEEVIYSYYRIQRDNFWLIKEIYWDAEFDLKIIKVIINEYITLDHNWKNIFFSGFSMGGRYATHLIELLNAELYSMLFIKTYIMQYVKGESTYPLIKERSIKRIADPMYLSKGNDEYTLDVHPQINPELYSNFEPQTFYTTKYNSEESISQLFKEVESFLKYSSLKEIDKTPRKRLNKHSAYVMDNIIVYLKYSLEDPLVLLVRKYTIGRLQDQIYLTYLTYDNDDKHNINSAVGIVGDLLRSFTKEKVKF